jgi:hypothetical protein
MQDVALWHCDQWKRKEPYPYHSTQMYSFGFVRCITWADSYLSSNTNSFVITKEYKEAGWPIKASFYPKKLFLERENKSI